MRCLAVCQDELVIRMLDEILLPGFEVEFIVESGPLARRLHDAGVTLSAGDPRRTDTFVKADLGPGTCVIIEDNGRRSLKKILDAVRDAGGALVYVLGHRRRADSPARRGVPRRLSRRHVPLDGGAVRRSAADRVQPVADARARPAVSALLRGRRPRPDHAAQRSGSGRDGQRPGAPQRPAPHEDHGHHRRDPGRDAAGKPADGEPARHPRRADHDRVAQGIRSRRDGGRAAALLRRPGRSRRSRHRPSSRSSRATRRSSRTSGRTTDRRRRFSPSISAPWT